MQKQLEDRECTFKPAIKEYCRNKNNDATNISFLRNRQKQHGKNQAEYPAVLEDSTIREAGMDWNNSIASAHNSSTHNHSSINFNTNKDGSIEA